MKSIKLQPKMIDALRSAGATEEIVALMQSCFDACIKPGRPRQYANRTERNRAYRERRKQREKVLAEAPDTHALSLEEVKAIHATARNEIRDEIPRFVIDSRQRLLLDAAQGHADPAADVASPASVPS
jgi:hypothetical protein